MSKRHQKRKGFLATEGKNVRKILKVQKKAWLNDVYMQQDFRNSLSDAYHQKKKLSFENGAKTLSQPFPCYVLPNFIAPNEYLIQLQEELFSLKMHSKDNDLYHFQQSGDLSNETSPQIKILRNMLNDEVLAFMKDVTNIPLDGTIDLTCSLYCQSDYLLCHDDELDGRRIAFIFYLVPEWNENYGGTLDLFDSDNGQPTEVEVSLQPVWNNFVFFEVSPVSFHQVSEVLKDKKRLSVSGWFHGSSLHGTSPKLDLALYLREARSFQGDILNWINPLYLKPGVQLKIRNIFEENSEIELQDFLNESKYAEVSKALSECNCSWEMQGPANKRHYALGINLPEVVNECVCVLQSQEMCLILSNLTGLTLHTLADVEYSDSSSSDESVSEKCSSSVTHSKARKRKIPSMAEVATFVRQWTHGCYTLLHDQDSKSGLDGILYFNCQGYSDKFGGCTSYIAEDIGSELLRISPKLNSYALVYKDEKTTSFVKYINCQLLENSKFQDITTMYNENIELGDF